MFEFQNPLVSVIIPVFNGEKYISEAIGSVLMQDYVPIELIVVDDGSTDQTAEIVQNYGDQLVYLCQENQGVSVARNSGIAYAHGSFLAFLDADDVWAAGKLARQAALLTQNARLDAVYSRVDHFFTPEASETFKANTQIPPNAMPSYASTSMLIRRDAFDLVGLFTTTANNDADIDWRARSQEAGLLSEMLPDTFYYRRLHPANTSMSHKPDTVWKNDLSPHDVRQ